MDAAHTGLEGDGIVAVLPVYNVYRIRMRAEMHPEELYGNPKVSGNVTLLVPT